MVSHSNAMVSFNVVRRTDRRKVMYLKTSIISKIKYCTKYDYFLTYRIHEEYLMAISGDFGLISPCFTNLDLPRFPREIT